MKHSLALHFHQFQPWPEWCCTHVYTYKRLTMLFTTTPFIYQFILVHLRPVISDNAATDKTSTEVECLIRVWRLEWRFYWPWRQPRTFVFTAVLLWTQSGICQTSIGCWTFLSSRQHALAINENES